MVSPAYSQSHETSGGRLSSGGGVLIFVALFLGLAFVLRMALLPGGSADDGEQLVYAQAWSWGYKGNQPPLYTWLVVAAFNLLGPSLWAVVAIKYICLYLVFVGVYLAARAMTDDRFGAIAGLSVLGFYYLAWDSLLTYSNSVMVAAFMGFSFWGFCRAIQAGGLWRYSLFGLLIGLGLLTKYNFVLFITALVFAALMTAAIRERLQLVPFIVALGLAMVMFAPHGLWLLDASHSLLNADAGLPGQDKNLVWWQAILFGWWDLFVGSVAFTSPLIVLVAVFFRDGWVVRRLPKIAHSEWLDFLAWFMGLFLGLLALGMALQQMPEVRNHWLMPLIALPVYLALRMQIAGVTDHQVKCLNRALVATAAVVLVALVGRSIYIQQTCGKCVMAFDPKPLAETLEAEGFNGGMIVDYGWPDFYGAGLRPHFNGLRAVTVRFESMRPEALATPGQCLLMVRADHRLSDKRGDHVALVAKQHYGVTAIATSSWKRVEVKGATWGGQTIPFLVHLVSPENQGRCG